MDVCCVLLLVCVMRPRKKIVSKFWSCIEVII